MHGRFVVALVALVSLCETAQAKKHGINTPGGRQIYDSDETFAEVVDSDTRFFIVETTLGAGPEGNLGMLLGLINKPVRGLEFYVGFGLEANPARHYTATARYAFNIDGYRPYVAAGYMHKDLYVLRTYSHNLFAEIGYSWKLHRTSHLTAGAGVARILHVGIRSDSPLLEDDVDPELLAEQRDGISRWTPMIAVRFSRAF